MLIQAIGASLPAAMGVALSPFSVIGIVLILGGRDGRRNGPMFAIGWLVGLTVVASLSAFVFGGADDPDSPSSAIADWGRVAIGAALIFLGVRTWLRRPPSGAEVEQPAWMSSVADVSSSRALVLGLLLSGANAKNFVLSASAATSIVEAGAHGVDKVVAVGVFVLLGSFAVLGAVVAHRFGGQSAATTLEAVGRFMTDYSSVIMTVILLILGATVFGDGLIGLGR